jgi:uncharacterized membrane protein
MTYDSTTPPPPPSYPTPPAGPTPPPRNNTQVFGILGIVLAVLCCPLLGVLFGWLSMNEAKKTGSDQTLGKVAFWLGIALAILGLIGSAIACATGLFSANWSTSY